MTFTLITLNNIGNTLTYVGKTGRRIQKSTGTSDKIDAQQYHDKFKAELWHVDRLQKKPNKSWQDAVIKWLNESKHKRSLIDDKYHLKWLDPFLHDKYLSELNQDLIEQIACAKEKTGVKPTSVNRLLEVI